MIDQAATTRTFLITDIEGSTRLWEEHHEAMAPALAVHDRLLAGAVEQAGGIVVKTTGDGLLAVFDAVDAAIGAALEGQRALVAHDWGATGPLRVRMAIHTGAAHHRDDDYFGPVVNRVARLLAIGHGGQILVSGASRALVDVARPDAYELLDRGEHRLRDLDRPERVFEVRAAGLATEFPALRSLDAQLTNLPIQLTSFVGRERELGEASELLADHRVVTLAGVGGTGKTRLMLQVAAEVVDRFRDGAWLVELAPLVDPGLVGREVGRTLGVREAPGQPPLEALIDHLRFKQVLVALDNCEHVIGAAADLVEAIVTHCPGVSIIATSREALALAGEAVLPVPSLGLPDANPDAADGGRDADDLRLKRIAASESVRLFVERASASAPGFSVNAANAAAIVEICRRLDGIPLALELAAARTNVLSVQDIAQRLGDRFRLLTGGRRTAAPRQQTLQATIDWSWDLLAVSDRLLLQRLAVFAGGWTLEAAAAVGSLADGDAAGGADRALDVLDTLDGLGRLVDRSLVVVDRGAHARYRMLETIRQYAMAHLVASGEVGRVRDAHLAFYQALILEAESGLHGPDMVDWLARLDADADNLRAALEWAFEDDVEAALQLCVSFMSYWYRRSAGSESVDWLGRALTAVRELPTLDSSVNPARTALVARVLAAAAVASTMWATNDAAPAWAEESLVLARETDDLLAQCDALTALVDTRRHYTAYITTTFNGDVTGIRELGEELIELATRHGEWWRVSRAHAVLALYEAYLAPEAAEVHIAKAVEAARRSADPYEFTSVAYVRGLVASDQGRWSDARHWFTEGQQRSRDLGDRRFELMSQSELAHVARRTGSLDESEAIYRETIIAWRQMGNRGAIAHQLESFAFLALARGERLRAAHLFGAAESLREAAGASMLPVEREEYESAVARMRLDADGPALDWAWAEGRQMGAEAAVEYAVALDETKRHDLRA
ncbi:MAG: ATP-binding protein [Candidatus Limnocylindrales bacterium]